MKSAKNYSVFFIVLLQALFCTQTIVYGIENDGSRYTFNSTLETPGKWIKIKVGQNAIYKLTYDDLVEWGLNPEKTRVFGYGGWPLSENFTSPYLDDLPEVACWKSGSSEAFNQDDFLLFYGRGVVKWSYTYTSAVKEFVHENNPYSTYGAYFLTDSDEFPGNPKRMDLITNLPISGTNVDFFEDYMVYEKDEFSIAQSGRELYGENFSGNNTQYFPFHIPGLLEDKASIFLSFASKVTAATNLSLYVNNNKVIDENITLPSNAATMLGISFEKWTPWVSYKNEYTEIRIEHLCGTTSAYLNFIRLNMTRKLQYYDTNYTFFRNSNNLRSDVCYNIENATADLLVFDITDNYDAKLIETEYDGVDVLSFNVEQGNLIREFALVDPAQDFPTPDIIGDVVNQNLHGLEQIDMAIISPKIFLAEAEKLAQEHRTRTNLKVEVVMPEQVFNEFSSGTPDASAYRRFMKMFFDRGKTNGSNLPKYLLLFGDGMFDNRFLDPMCNAFNKEIFLLTYQVKESLKLDESYVGDDYFGLLDETEDLDARGDFRPSNGAKKLMLGIGRFPVQTLTGAKNIVDKTISYMANTDYGIWKNSVVFVADDSDSTQDNLSFTLHMKQADSIAYSVMQKLYPEYMTSKIYMDAFKPENSGGQKSFANTAKKKFMNALHEGCLVLNYTGHGGNLGLADGMLNFAEVASMNYKNLPLWITATCDFAEFDSPTPSIGEEILMREKSGAIALITTTRVVYAQDNLKLNKAVMEHLFAKKGGKRPTLGDVIKDAKNSLGTNHNKLNYLLLGDPALTLNYPTYQIEVELINDQLANGTPIVLKALEQVNVKGHIKNEAGIKDTNFNGPFFANIFDGIQTFPTVTKNTSGNPSYFTDYHLIAPIYCDVVDGEFEFDFTIMKDIAGTMSLGKMNMYAFNNSGKEAQNSFMNYNVFGTDASFDPEDTTAPTIRSIYLNDPSFSVSNNVVHETPLFMTEVTDNYGINMSGAGTGHDIQLIIDNSPAKTYNLNAFYKASSIEKNTGTISYSLPALTEGMHTLTFQVWNIINNVTIEKFEFEVKKSLRPQTYDLTANTNPAKIGTEISFDFSHNKPEVHVEVTASVFDLSGRLVWSYKQTGPSDLMSVQEIPWNLKTDDGVFVQPGIYMYNACVKSENGVETTKTKKIIITGQ